MERPVRRVVVDKKTVNGLTLVTLSGELDVASAPLLRRTLTSAPEAVLPDIAVDLRQVSFMDCAVVGVLIGVYKRTRIAGGCLRLAGAHAATLRLLRLSALDDVFCLHGSVVAATAFCVRHGGEESQARPSSRMPATELKGPV